MIRPHKYLDLNNSLISVGAEVLKILMQEPLIRIPDIENALIDAKGERSLELFLPALSLLFILNKIEYHKGIDSIEYIG
ncbi:MAG: ABC-three component system middle component 8 [bacterium]